MAGTVESGMRECEGGRGRRWLDSAGGKGGTEGLICSCGPVISGIASRLRSRADQKLKPTSTTEASTTSRRCLSDALINPLIIWSLFEKHYPGPTVSQCREALRR